MAVVAGGPNVSGQRRICFSWTAHTQRGRPDGRRECHRVSRSYRKRSLHETRCPSSITWLPWRVAGRRPGFEGRTRWESRHDTENCNREPDEGLSASRQRNRGQTLGVHVGIRSASCTGGLLPGNRNETVMPTGAAPSKYPSSKVSVSCGTRSVEYQILIQCHNVFWT